MESWLPLTSFFFPVLLTWTSFDSHSSMRIKIYSLEAVWFERLPGGSGVFWIFSTRLGLVRAFLMGDRALLTSSFCTSTKKFMCGCFFNWINIPLKNSLLARPGKIDLLNVKIRLTVKGSLVHGTTLTKKLSHYRKPWIRSQGLKNIWMSRKELKRTKVKATLGIF